MKSEETQIVIPPSIEYLPAASNFILATAEKLNFSFENKKYISQTCDFLLREIFSNSLKGNFTDYIKIYLLCNQFELKIEILNKNFPLEIESLLQKKNRGQDIAIENLGHGGQKIALKFLTGLDHQSPAQLESKTIANEIGQENEEHFLSVRLLEDGEEIRLTELFFNVYGYNYIHQYVYFPEQIMNRRKSGDLISIVGTDKNNNIIGHVGLVKLNNHPIVFEAALGVVNPRTKSRGLFSQIFQFTMDYSKSIPMSYCIFDFVTNHDFTQKLVSRYDSIDLAIFVGCQSKENQASLKKLGIGNDPDEMDRYSLLLSLSLREKNPFGKNITLPTSLGEIFGGVLLKLGVSWHPSPRFDHLNREGEFLTTRESNQKSVLFDLYKPGRSALRRIVLIWQQLLREGYQYAGVNVPLSEPGLHYVYDFLSTKGFFISGLIPYNNSSQLGIRFQALGPTRVAFDQIKLHTETSRRLLQEIKQDYVRNSII